MISRYIDEAEKRALDAHRGPPQDAPWWFDELRDRFWDTFILALMSETEQYLGRVCYGLGKAAPNGTVGTGRGRIGWAEDLLAWAGVTLSEDDWKQVASLYKLRNFLAHNGRYVWVLCEYDSSGRLSEIRGRKNTAEWVEVNILTPLHNRGDIGLNSGRLEFSRPFCEFAHNLVERHISALHEAIDAVTVAS